MMNYDAKYQFWIHTRSKCLLSASNLFLNVVPQFMTRASSSSRLSGSWVCLTWNALCFNTVTWEKTGTQLLNKLLLSTLFRLHITCVAAGAIDMCGVLSCPTQGTPKLLVALPLKNNSTSPLIPPALQRNDWVSHTPYLPFLIRKCPKGIDLFDKGGLLIYSFKYLYSG